MTWDVFPVPTGETSIEMTADVASDGSGVEYYFNNMTDPAHDSGWQEERDFIDVNLEPNTLYCYQVMARDQSIRHNETEWSSEKCVMTMIPPDMNAPTPNPMDFDVNDPNGGVPHDVWVGPDVSFGWWVEMTALTAIDDSGQPVAYFFECNKSWYNSGWIATPYYAVLAGEPGSRQSLAWRCRARDVYGNMTEWSPWYPTVAIVIQPPPP